MRSRALYILQSLLLVTAVITTIATHAEREPASSEESLLSLLNARISEAKNIQGTSTAPFVFYRELQPYYQNDALKDNEYGAKLSFFAWGERSAVSRFANAVHKSSQAQFLFAQNEIALDVYRNVVEMRANKELIKLLDEKITIQEKLSEVLRNYVKLGNSDVDKLLNSELDLVRTKTRRDQARAKQESDDEDSQILLKDLRISEIPTLYRVWSNYEHTLTGPSLKTSLVDLEHEQKTADVEKAQAARWRILDSVDTSIDKKQNFQFKVTLNVPLGDEKDTQAYAEQAKGNVDLIKYRRNKRAALDEDATEALEFKNLFNEYQVLAKIVKERKNSPSLVRKGRGVTDSLVIVQSRLLVLESQEQLIQTEKNTLIKYLECFARYGKLAEMPLKNYLTLR